MHQSVSYFLICCSPDASVPTMISLSEALLRTSFYLFVLFVYLYFLSCLYLFWRFFSPLYLTISSFVTTIYWSFDRVHSHNEQYFYQRLRQAHDNMLNVVSSSHINRYNRFLVLRTRQVQNLRSYLQIPDLQNYVFKDQKSVQYWPKSSHWTMQFAGSTMHTQTHRKI